MKIKKKDKFVNTELINILNFKIIFSWRMKNVTYQCYFPGALCIWVAHKPY